MAERVVPTERTKKQAAAAPIDGTNSVSEKVKSLRDWCAGFVRRHWLGTTLLIIATFIFFWPIIIRIGTYSPGGDAMFNAWEMSRNQHCILRQACPNYFNANIFYPNKNTMLYTEEQLSPAIVTLPFHWLTQNPILAYNVVTIILFFLSGWCMYLLAKYLSRGRELVSILAGLAFEFAPFKMASIWHLQNLSIFCLPLAVLVVLKYIDSRRRISLVLLLAALLYVNFASWVQMVFVYLALGVLLGGLLIFKAVRLRPLVMIGLIMAVAAIMAVPLALQYVKFAKTNHASFNISEQELYNSALADYLIPHDGTIIGKLYYKLRPHAVHNAYNLDSYSYHGLVLYFIGAATLVLVFIWRKKAPGGNRTYALLVTLAAIGVVGFIISLGPFLKLKYNYIYSSFGGLPVVILMPYALVDKFLPQLAFIRAVGRASALLLFTLCCSLAYVPAFMAKLGLRKQLQTVVLALIALLIAVELMPLHLIGMNNLSYSYNLQIPAVYKFVAAHKDIDGIAVLRGSDDYSGAPIPIARAEDVLWSGYYNRNIFNGYSGYTPPAYEQEYIDFINFSPAVIPEMHLLHIHYVIVDKLLSGPTSHKPQLLHDISSSFPLLYQDGRYVLFRVT